MSISRLLHPAFPGGSGLNVQTFILLLDIFVRIAYIFFVMLCSKTDLFNFTQEIYLLLFLRENKSTRNEERLEELSYAERI